MQSRSGSSFGIFIVAACCCILLFFFSHFSFFSPIRGGVEKAVITIQKAFSFSEGPADPTEIDRLKAENQKLQTQLAKQHLLIQDNQALRDQFAKSETTAKALLPAIVLNHKDLDSLLIDKGSLDGVEKGHAVIVSDNLIGKIISVTPHMAKVQLTMSDDFSVAAQTVKTNALGVIHGEGGDGIVLENVLLSDKLEVSDVIVTKGDKDEKGRGVDPNLIIGKIVSIDKKASALYQNAKVESFIDTSRLKTVFIVRQ